MVAEVAGNATIAPEDVPAAVNDLIERYSPSSRHTLDQIIDFHVQFERIHPFQDGNGGLFMFEGRAGI